MDGVDAGLIETDGTKISTFGPTAFIPYEGGFVESLKGLLGPDPHLRPNYDHIVGELTALNGDAVEKLLIENDLLPDSIHVIGYHGQTVYHAPGDGITIQLGDGQALADRTRITVVNDFRSADMAGGGQGAPFAPIYHQVLSLTLEKPLAVLNLGGVGNVTVLGPGEAGGKNGEDEILAFDTGPASALIDDWVFGITGQAYDDGGKLAAVGTVDNNALDQLMDHPYFDLAPPKSLDRNDFDASPVANLTLEDGAATLNAFTVKSIVRACDHLGHKPKRWLVCGGGRHNQTMMRTLNEALEVPVEPVEVVGWQGDALEAQAFALLAVRNLYGLPTSLPSTTGTAKPISGGVVYQPRS